MKHQEVVQNRAERTPDHAVENCCDTLKNPPYYASNSAGGTSQFAVSPACDNPIQLIGLYPKSNNPISPYGRHDLPLKQGPPKMSTFLSNTRQALSRASYRTY